MENSTFNFQRKKGINAEIKQYQEQKAEAERFETLQEKKSTLLVNYLVWKLFHIERNITTTEETIVSKTDSLRATNEELVRFENSNWSADETMSLYINLRRFLLAE